MVEALVQKSVRPLSPALRSFEVNPFRALRLSVQASTTEATFQAERALTLVRAGLTPDGLDLLPWLPSPGVYEVQQAAQTVEEPLARLIEQLLWFDSTRDSSNAALPGLLSEMSIAHLRQHLEEEVQLPDANHCDATDEAGISVVAQAVNQANMRLLIAASMVNGAMASRPTAAIEQRQIARGEWQTLHGLTVLPDAHNMIAGTSANTDAAHDARLYWEGGLRRWALILAHPWFRLYLSACITDLGDDFISVDDVEAIEEGIRTRLADLSVKEMRFLLLDGRYPLAGGMISAVARSGFEKRVLGPALRPIHHLFQAEIVELGVLLDQTEQDGLPAIDDYLKRLEVIKQRWRKMDETGIVGLDYLLDDALEAAYLRLRNLDRLSQSTELLTRISNLATAASLRERVNFFQREVEEARNRLCYFCKTGQPNYDKSVVLKGKKETGRVRNYNSTTVYYSFRYLPVLRCERCANFHDFLRHFGILTTWFVALPITGFMIWFFAPLLIYVLGALVVICWLGIFLLIAVVSAIVKLLAKTPGFFAARLARWLTPPDHRRYGETDYTAESLLYAEGYGIESTDWRSNAISKLKTV